jgi:hypothetical protein
VKRTSWIDKNGFKKVSLLRDTDPEFNAERGVLVGPPDVTKLDWMEIAKDLNNGLFDNGLRTEADLGGKDSQFMGAILSAIRKRLIELYRRRQ